VTPISPSCPLASSIGRRRSVKRKGRSRSVPRARVPLTRLAFRGDCNFARDLERVPSWSARRRRRRRRRHGRREIARRPDDGGADWLAAAARPIPERSESWTCGHGMRTNPFFRPRAGLFLSSRFPCMRLAYMAGERAMCTLHTLPPARVHRAVPFVSPSPRSIPSPGPPSTARCARARARLSFLLRAHVRACMHACAI